MTIRTAMLAGVFLAGSLAPGFAQQYLPDDQGGRQQLAQQYFPEDQNQQNQGSTGVQGQRMPMQRQGGAFPLEALMRGRHMEMMGRLVSALASGTFFRLKHGDDEIIVHCPQGGPNTLQNCVTAATALIKAFPQMGQESTDEHDHDQNQPQ